MRLEDLYELFADDESGFEASFDVDGNFYLRGTDEIIAMADIIGEAIEKVVFMATSMGMFIPDEVFNVAKDFVEKDGVPKKGEDY